MGIITLEKDGKPLTEARSVGGKTGSKKINIDGVAYQYKPPIKENSWVRRTKARHADSENFGEVLAARIAEAFDPSPVLKRVPEVSFVVIPGSPYVSIASKYLTGDKDGVKTLNEYLDSGNKRTKSHVKLIAGADNPDKGLYDINRSDWPLKTELANAIALSALVGDHDVNPGNMMVIQQNGTHRIGRIDYGHAFKDLMRYPNFGGQKVHDNNIIDFFNRETVDGRKAKSKLWRDYPGLIPSREMAEALTTLAGKPSGDMKAAVADVKVEVNDVLRRRGVDQEQVIKSFQRMSEHVSGRGALPEVNNQEKVNLIFNGLESYVEDNMRQMAYAAKVMTLQLDIQDAVKADNKEALAACQVVYNQLSRDRDGPFAWFKEEEKKPPFAGNFTEYVESQKNKNKLIALSEQIDTLLNGNPGKKEEAAARSLQAIIINPKKSVEEKISALQDKAEKLKDDPELKSGLFSKLFQAIRNLFSSSNSPTPEQAPKRSFSEFKSKFQETIGPRTNTESPQEPVNEEVETPQSDAHI